MVMAEQRQRRIDSNALSIGEVFRKPLFYRVPVYQRDFAWTAEQVDVLWNDLVAAMLHQQSEYFLGAVVLAPASDEKSREIVDGQQRLTLLSMIFSAIAEEWQRRGDDKRATGVFRDFLGSEDRRTGDVIAKLALNENNDGVYQTLVLKRDKLPSAQRKTMSASNRLLEGAHSRIQDKLTEWLKEARAADDRLLDFEEFLAGETNLIVIEVGDESDAFVIFETLNDRGLELAVSDLVKNYLFSLAGNNIDRFKRTWADMSLLLGSDNLTAFLRYYWISEHELVRERELYRSLRSHIKTQGASRQFVDKLRRASDLYAALLNAENAYWSDFPADVGNTLDALLLFKVTQYRPVALAAMEAWKPAEIAKLLQMLMVLSFRYTVISGLATGALEPVYAEAAHLIRSGSAKSPAKVFAALKSVYVTDSRFAQDFAARMFNKASIARYILSEINNLLENDPEKQVAERAGRITLEHILPMNGGAEWKGAIPRGEDQDKYVECIGNLTLLEKGRNRGIANAGFKKKKSGAFAKSTLAINKQLMKYSSWTSKEIGARSQHLADLAQKIWRIDY